MQKALLASLVLCSSVASHAFECTEWIDHLKLDHKINFRPKPYVRIFDSRNSKCRDVGHATWEVCVDEKDPHNSVDRVRLLPGGKTISVEQGVYRFDVTISSQGYCENFSAMVRPSFRIDKDVLKKNHVTDEHKMFYYDWKICQAALTAVGHHSISEAELPRLPFANRQLLSDLNKKARTAPFGAVGKPDTTQYFYSLGEGPTGLVESCLAAEYNVQDLNIQDQPLKFWKRFSGARSVN